MNEDSVLREKARLVVQDGEFEGMTYEIVHPETIIGRNPTTHITLLDDGISREHALILYEESDRSFTVEDLQSTNGTKVNGKRVRSAELSPGDTVRVGNTSFVFELGSTV